MKKNKAFISGLLVLLAILMASMVLSIAFGSAPISVRDVWAVLRKNCLGLSVGREVANSVTTIVMRIRLPRAILSAAVGAGLSLCGVVIQAVVRNPLANPYVLGIQSGATMGATAAILLGLFSSLGQVGTSLGAFIGALGASAVVFIIAFSGRSRKNTVKLLLTGMAVSSICSAISNFIVSVSSNVEGIQTISFWTMGSIAVASWKNLKLPVAVVTLGSLYFLTQFRNMNLLLVGDDSAVTLGVNVVRLRKLYLLISAMMTGVIVSVVGTIGFVGLIVPHIVRIFVGADCRKVMPASLLAGAIFLIWSDVLARTLLGKEELSIGIITSVIGGGVFIWCMCNKSYGVRD